MSEYTYSNPYEQKMLQRNIGEAERAKMSVNSSIPQARSSVHRGTLQSQDEAWFFGQVAPGRPWDIKHERNWNEQFSDPKDGVKFFHHAFPFIFAGRIATAEDMGNILYGATGAALGFGEEYLKWMGATPNITQNLTNPFRKYFGDDENDLVQIAYGVKLYHDLQAHGSAASTR